MDTYDGGYTLRVAANRLTVEDLKADKKRLQEDIRKLVEAFQKKYHGMVRINGEIASQINEITQGNKGNAFVVKTEVTIVVTLLE